MLVNLSILVYYLSLLQLFYDFKEELTFNEIQTVQLLQVQLIDYTSNTASSCLLFMLIPYQDIDQESKK